MTEGPSATRELMYKMRAAFETGMPLDELNLYFTEDYVRHADGGDYSLEQLREIIEVLRHAFPDLHTATLDIVCEGDRIAYRWLSTGTQSGPYLDVPPTHKRVETGGINIARIEDGRVAEEWSSWNKASFLEALGIHSIG